MSMVNKKTYLQGQTFYLDEANERKCHFVSGGSKLFRLRTTLFSYRQKDI